jgi:formate-dependent nitrite reductase cytochrome c552 subunit
MRFDDSPALQSGESVRERGFFHPTVAVSRCARTAGFFLAASLAAIAQNVQHLGITQPGGMPGVPVVTGVERVTNGVNIAWDGPSGYYQLFETESLTDPAWKAVGKATNLLRQISVKTNLPSAFYRVAGPLPKYAGSAACADCHSPVRNSLAHTHHFEAFTNAEFLAKGGQTNASCLPCHTVGCDLPTGFVSRAKTPKLEGVQCENCHGPAARHAANPDDPAWVPRVEVAATVCGGCHTSAYHPTFEEWAASPHNAVISNLNAKTQIGNCGRCHSGSARWSLIQGQAPLVGDANMGIVCITCHDPHQTNRYPAQLRYPVASTNDYFMPTNGAFARYYNPKINVCGQCHNDTGASWTNTAAPPHFSAQYNMLLGTDGELASGLAPYQPGSHALLLTNQCVECHMQTSPFVSEAVPAVTGHNFAVNSYNLCLDCHPFPELLEQFTQGAISNEVQLVKLELDYWATNNAPAALRSYGTNAWEYTTTNVFSLGGPGPGAAEQALIPTNIQKARFNVYVVLSDKSLGIHNPEFCVTLLETAEDWIAAELGQ